ncbi:hypothetical protein [uncultured Paraglaciecola sp.]|uniref:hypothetical protein n=1 Tax=uncultured Paraglaciecola sp. TaxID=1765024 RepID=UPI00260D5CF6|nr:hypothetical protein [uncultured Paraglaciecola sp.]
MPILIDIVTTSEQILDANGVKGYGTLQIRPNKAYTYFDGVSTITVSDAPIDVVVEAGKIVGTLQLQPNTGASNSPETYYTVDINVNGTLQRIFWQIDAASPTPIEFGAVPELPSGTDPNDPVQALKDEPNPFGQYLLRSDTADSPIIGQASDARGYVPRTNPATGKIPTTFIVGAGGITAADVPIVDAGGYYPTDNVEAALQTVGAEQGVQDTNISNNATAITDKVAKAGDTMTGTLTFNKTLSASNLLQDWQQGYGLYSDNVGVGSDNTRVSMNAPDGGEFLIGPRPGSETVGRVTFKADELRRQDNGGILRTVWDSANDGAGSGLDADLLDGFQSSKSTTGDTVAVRESSGELSVQDATALLSAINLDQLIDGGHFSLNGSDRLRLNIGVETGPISSFTYTSNGGRTIRFVELPDADERLYYGCGFDSNNQNYAISLGLGAEPNGAPNICRVAATDGASMPVGTSIRLFYINGEPI